MDVALRLSNKEPKVATRTARRSAGGNGPSAAACVLPPESFDGLSSFITAPVHY